MEFKTALELAQNLKDPIEERKAARVLGLFTFPEPLSAPYLPPIVTWFFFFFFFFLFFGILRLHLAQHKMFSEYKMSSGENIFQNENIFRCLVEFQKML